jgi:hypothetical protein
MKKAIFILLFLTSSSVTILAQAPPPPPASANQGGNGPVGGGGAPIDGGLVTALVLVAGFGAWKLLKASQKREFRPRSAGS